MSVEFNSLTKIFTEQRNGEKKIDKEKEAS